MLTLVVFLLTLSILVLVHELGHFLAARKAGIKVEEFGFGYPPRIFGKKVGETVYSINWIPFGGFVKLLGEEVETADLRHAELVSASPAKRAMNETNEILKRVQDDNGSFVQGDASGKFYAKSKKARFGVIVAGVVGNFLLGILCFSIVYSILGVPVKTDRIQVVGLAPDSPAKLAGIKEDDSILELDGEKISSTSQFTDLIVSKNGSEIRLLIKREKDSPCEQKVLGGGPTSLDTAALGVNKFSCVNGNLLFFIIPRTVPPEGEGSLGVVISDTEMKKFSVWQMPFRGGYQGLKEAFGWAGLIARGIGKTFTDLIFLGKAPQDVAGPLGIMQMTGQVAKNGILDLIQFVGILSINLAVINILPLPALDGGRLTFLLYEIVFKRKPRASVERWVNAFGMTFLMGLIILITVSDVIRIFNLGEVIGGIGRFFSR